MLELPGYKYITHKIIPRSTCTECRFTADKEGRHFNEVILVPDEKVADEDLTKLILASDDIDPSPLFDLGYSCVDEPEKPKKGK